MGMECYDSKSSKIKRNLTDKDNKNIIPQILLLKNIKSNYLVKYLFSFINESQKFEIIKYNKYIQKILQIYIGDYEILSGRYKIEDNGKVQEYTFDGDILVFEGEYLSGIRNGKGKEYDNKGNKKFKGEYLNGKRNGKGKEYYGNGNL